ARLYVAEFAEGSVAILNTQTMAVSSVLKGSIQHPRAIAVTNNNNANDDDELILLPEFYGDVTPEANDATTLDRSRSGRVRVYDAGTLSPQNPILFPPRDSKIVPDVAGATTSVFCSPNQLYGIAVRRSADGSPDKIYVPTVCASP